MNKSLSNGKYIIYNPAFKDIGESREKEGKQGEILKANCPFGLY